MEAVTIMVNNARSRKQQFDLDAVKSAVRRRGSFTITPTARRDASNLGYDTDQVKEVVLNLTNEDFHGVWVLDEDRRRSIQDADGKRIVYDVYKPKITAPNGDRCPVYLKLNYTDGQICVTSVQSFHLDR
ncbi:type II toxin-antitoxin system MqsR family toxin [Stutzerimonas nitrititolerans]|uniref:type II toxin-antitoxin system MqsR family toxin n=1 Tax=Stutzerimonas nitrititolerans TaxID=2482751 RepID=UPI0028A792F3|nr:type II toxin-antitoxin system MqsR family toxin [Stutzerimonas nitrititolerans]